MYMKKALFLCLLLTGCVATPVHNDGKHLTYEHGLGAFKSAMKDAIKQCRANNMSVKHTRTDCPHVCISSFECI